MNRFAAKIMGVALALPMVLGGLTVNADQVVYCPAAPSEENQSEDTPVVPGDQVYQEDIYISGTRKPGETYKTGTETFIAPVSGTYYFVTSDEDDNYMYAVQSVEPVFTIEGVTSNNPGDYWGCNSVVYLEAGEHEINWQGRRPGWFTLTGTLLWTDAYETAVGEPICFDDEMPAVPETSEGEPVIYEAELPAVPIVPSVPAVASSSASGFSSIPIDARIASIKNFVGHMYLECLGRDCEAGELDYWVNKMISGNVTGTDIAVQILTSTEFSEKSLTDEEFVAVLNTVFGIKSGQDCEILDALSQGASRESVIGQFAESSDWASKCAFYCVNV